MVPVLLLIDVQHNMLLPPEPVPAAATVAPAIAAVLARARAAGASVIHVRNNGTDDDPDVPGTPGWELIHDVLPGEPVVDKSTPDSFADTPLSTLLPPGAPLVVAGLQSDFCVRATTLEALRRGHAVTLVTDAHATYDGSVPAAEASAAVAAELASAGASLAPSEVVHFG
ncbi:isochorismatase family protein [Amycolatopsis rhabdoformis]|uniref:Isochorismatase family protein n=1 Tax=Amycolatopsis rhabdoformis TaxID=1448059 RepID=A0ABZ1HXC2_9PSEU|nr:isochorismatase family protein [Amycolatopsis rhabdoformis]WSE26819.1 isochorismatase family protein [Amycolatopsis rhabdoformis]